MKATSKLISVVLILAMCLSLFTVSAFADSSVIVGEMLPPSQIGGNGTDDSSVSTSGTQQPAIVGDVYTGGADIETVEASGTGEAVLSASNAISAEPAVTTVSNEDQLFAAAAKGGEIRLADNIVMTAPLTLGAGTTLDLNSKTLSFSPKGNQGPALGTAIVGNGAVTVKNGAVVVSGNAVPEKNGILNTGFQSVASGVTFNSVNVNFNAPTEWAIFGSGVGLVYGSYNRDVSAWVGSQFELTESNGIFVIKDKTAAPEVPAETATEPAAAEGEAAATEGEQNTAEGENAAAEGEQNAAESETVAAEGEQNTAEGEAVATEDQQAEVEVEGEDANAEGEDANAEGEPAAEGEQTDENALPESDEQQAAENPADDEPADETPVNVVEEEEKVLEEEVRTDIDAEEDETDVVTLTGTDPVSGAVVIIKGKNLPEGLTVVVKPLSLDTIDGLAEDERAVLALDISLVDAEGNEYEPKDDPNVGAVSVQIKHASLSKLEEDETLNLYHVVDDVTQTVGSAAQTAEDTLDFATGSFSPFIITASSGDGTANTGSTGEVHKKVIKITNMTGDIYVKGSADKLIFRIEGGAIPESISVVDPDYVSSGNAQIYKAGYMIYDAGTVTPSFESGASGYYDYVVTTKEDGSVKADPTAPSISDPVYVIFNKPSLANAPAGKWAFVFWFRDTTDTGAQRVYMVQYVTIVPNLDIKMLANMDEFGNYYWNKCDYEPLEFYLTAELDELMVYNSKGTPVVEYHYTDPKHVTVKDKYGNNKQYNVSEMLSVSDYITEDPVSHEFIAGKSLKLLPNLIHKLDFDTYTIRIHQLNHDIDGTKKTKNEIKLGDAPNPFVVTLEPGITVADGLNDYIKGKNVWIKFEACWPIDYDDNGKLCIWIGGQQISKDYYSISNDHQTLWIYRNLLDQLRSNNSYTLTARLWRLSPIDGHKETFYPASTSFNILAAGSTSYKSPKTGDNSNVALWAAVAVLSGGAVVALIPKKKKVKVSK